MAEKCWWEYRKRRFFLTREEGFGEKVKEFGFARDFLYSDYDKATRTDVLLEDKGICEMYIVRYRSQWGEARVIIKQRYDAQVELQAVEVVVETDEIGGKCDVMARVPPRCEEFGLLEDLAEESIIS